MAARTTSRLTSTKRRGARSAGPSTTSATTSTTRRGGRQCGGDGLVLFGVERVGLEARHGAKFFHPRPIARLFSNQDEHQIWQRRVADPAYQARAAKLFRIRYENAEQIDPAIAEV